MRLLWHHPVYAAICCLLVAAHQLQTVLGQQQQSSLSVAAVLPCKPGQHFDISALECRPCEQVCVPGTHLIG